MRRQAARLILALLFLVPLAGAGFTFHRVITSPLGFALVERTGDEVGAAFDRLWAEVATPDRIAARIDSLLDETPRNWVALDALTKAAVDMGVPLPPRTAAALVAANEQDRGRWAGTQTCLRCAADADACPLSEAMLCRVAVDLTVLGDIRDIVRESRNIVVGAEVDEVDLALSTVGLGATALVVFSGGTSMMIKTGAGIAKTAKRVGALSAPLLGVLRADAVRLVDWNVLAALRLGDVRRFDKVLASAVRPAPARRLGALADDLGRMRDSVGTVPALYLLRHVDDAGDARRVARAAEARPDRVVASMELAGKSRLTRALMRWSDEVRSLAMWLAGLAAAALGLVPTLVSRLLKPLKPALRRAARQ